MRLDLRINCDFMTYQHGYRGVHGQYIYRNVFFEIPEIDSSSCVKCYATVDEKNKYFSYGSISEVVKFDKIFYQKSIANVGVNEVVDFRHFSCRDDGLPVRLFPRFMGSITKRNPFVPEFIENDPLAADLRPRLIDMDRSGSAWPLRGEDYNKNLKESRKIISDFVLIDGVLHHKILHPIILLKNIGKVDDFIDVRIREYDKVIRSRYGKAFELFSLNEVDLVHRVLSAMSKKFPKQKINDSVSNLTVFNSVAVDFDFTDLRLNGIQKHYLDVARNVMSSGSRDFLKSVLDLQSDRILTRKELFDNLIFIDDFLNDEKISVDVETLMMREVLRYEYQKFIVSDELIDVEQSAKYGI